MSRQNTPSVENSCDATADIAHEALETKALEVLSTEVNDEHSVLNSNSSSLTNSPSPQHQQQNIRRTPGRPKNKLKRKAETEVQFQKPSSSTKVSHQDRATKVVKTEESYRVNGAVKPIHPPSRKQPKRNVRSLPSPSPPPTPVQSHSDRRKSHSRSLKAALKTQEYHASPKKNLSLSPSPAPNMANEKVVKRAEATEEQLKMMQKEALPALKKLETEFTKMRNQIYKEKYAELTKDVDAIQDGTSPLLIEKCQVAKDRYHQRIEEARKLRQYALWEVKSQFAGEQYAIDSQYLSEYAMLREQQRGRILQEQWSNEEAKILADSYLECVPLPDLPKPFSYENPPIVKPLGEEETANDLFKMRGNKEHISVPTSPEEVSPCMQTELVVEELPSRNAHLYLPHNQSQLQHSSVLPILQHTPWTMPDPCSSQGQNLVEVQAIGTDVLLLARTYYKVGDPVAVQDLSQASTFNGHIAGIGPNEVMLQRRDGTRTRIHFSQLAQGRYLLSKLADLPSVQQSAATQSPCYSRPWN
ncbi:Sin3 histone deacetylase corepressor complex component SDS3 [Entomophthora muscae]|uniref:Sin3 histone deacetylase corepressor complex component SDS3 n=1 Tax=Entomophthora muscae TaxID=34485 RepID=A0ACC2US87_9FUNG|nr:Sin3 histone deacetylase corepressor complex component SDS3 [Entomophthora muscae]